MMMAGLAGLIAFPEAAAAGNLISCDLGEDKIYIHDGITSSISSSFSSPATSIFGLAYDGENLISTDLTEDKIYIHDGITATVDSSFDSPASDLRGVTIA
jgi:6-phosphogluconolactonase (cycloisomerase 2 family)